MRKKRCRIEVSDIENRFYGEGVKEEEIKEQKIYNILYD